MAIHLQKDISGFYAIDTETSIFNQKTFFSCLILPINNYFILQMYCKITRFAIPLKPLQAVFVLYLGTLKKKNLFNDLLILWLN